MKPGAFIISFLFFCTTSYCQREILQGRFDEGYINFKLGRFDTASKIFTEVLEKTDINGVKKACYLYRGFSYEGLANYKLALMDFDKAVEFDSVDLATYVDRAKIKIKLNDIDGARTDYGHVLLKDSINNQGQAALYGLGLMEYQLKNYLSAITAFDQLVKLNRWDFEAFYYRGCAKEELADLAGAIADYDKALQIKPAYMEPYGKRGSAKIKILTSKGITKPTVEQTREACDDLQKAKSAGDKSVQGLIQTYCSKK